jgi:Concanavalin A-like lectin/glucanases superfamily
MKPLLITIYLLLSLSTAQASLVAYWQGEGNFQDSIGGHHGAALNGVGFATGMIGQGFSFDGVNDYIDVLDSGGSTSMNLSYQTVAMWLKPNMSPSSAAGVFPLDKRNGSPSFLGEYAMLVRGNGRYQVSVDSTAVTNPAINGTTLGTIPMDQWSHVAWTWNGSNLNFYLNGTLLTSSTSTGTIVQNTASLKIGARSDVTSFYKGIIDDIRIYDQALSASDISALVHPVPLPPAFIFFASAMLGYLGLSDKARSLLT